MELWLEVETCVFIVTHSISEAVFLGDRVWVFTPSPGRIGHEFKEQIPYNRRSDPMTTQESRAFKDVVNEIGATFRKLETEGNARTEWRALRASHESFGVRGLGPGGAFFGVLGRRFPVPGPRSPRTARQAVTSCARRAPLHERRAAALLGLRQGRVSLPAARRLARSHAGEPDDVVRLWFAGRGQPGFLAPGYGARDRLSWFPLRESDLPEVHPGRAAAQAAGELGVGHRQGRQPAFRGIAGTLPQGVGAVRADSRPHRKHRARHPGRVARHARRRAQPAPVAISSSARFARDHPREPLQRGPQGC